jgi:hypothetical protein
VERVLRICFDQNCCLRSLLALAVTLVSTASAMFAGAVAADSKAIGDELVRRTQEMFDAVAGGNPVPWSKNLASDAIYFDENGKSMDKAAMLATLKPLPNGYSGKIKVAHVVSRILPEVAILSYDLNETEVVFGQKLYARYHGTDTWLLRNSAWQIVAGQMFRFYGDPARVSLPAAKLSDYCGDYELAPGVLRAVICAGNKLLLKNKSGRTDQLLAECPDLFFRPGIEGRILFRRNQSGTVDSLIDRRNNEDLIWKKIDQHGP